MSPEDRRRIQLGGHLYHLALEVLGDRPRTTDPDGPGIVIDKNGPTVPINGNENVRCHMIHVIGEERPLYREKATDLTYHPTVDDFAVYLDRFAEERS